MKRGASHGRSGVSTFQDKGAMSRWVEYLRKSKEADMARVLSEEECGMT